MPLSTIYVEHVGDTSDSRGPRFLITGRHVDGTLGGFQVVTQDALRASLCERAIATQQAVQVLWRDGRNEKLLNEVALKQQSEVA